MFILVSKYDIIFIVLYFAHLQSSFIFAANNRDVPTRASHRVFLIVLKSIGKVLQNNIKIYSPKLNMHNLTKH